MTRQPDVGSAVLWHVEFVRVINCTKCTKETDKNLLRDADENVPQPGYIGSRYSSTRLLLVGQNPAEPTEDIKEMDRNYTAKLRDLRNAGPELAEHRYAALEAELAAYIPHWRLHGQHFPLHKCGLELADIAYCNLVRCRTVTPLPPPGRKKKTPIPNGRRTKYCRKEHFERWLDLLKPKAVVFIGKWASDLTRGGGRACEARGIPWTVKLRGHLTRTVRNENIYEVVNFVREHVHRLHPSD